MEKNIKNTIAKIFDICGNDYDKDYNIIQELCSHYESANIELRWFILTTMLQTLSYIPTKDINKWCKLIHKVVTLSNDDQKLIEDLIDDLIPKSNLKYSTTEMRGKKLALVFLLYYFVNKKDVFEVEINIMSKLLFVVSELLDDPSISLVAASVLSRCIDKVDDSDFVILVLPIVKSILDKNLSLNSCPQLYPILLSLKKEHKAHLATENVDLRNYDSKEEIVKFINILYNLSDGDVCSYFNSFLQSDIFELFWNCIMETFSQNRFAGREKQIALNCLVETLSTNYPSDNITKERRIAIVDTVWGNRSSWDLFLGQLFNSKSIFHSAYKLAVTTISTKGGLSDKELSERMFEYFLTKVGQKFHMMETNVSHQYRLSTVLIAHNNNVAQLEKYADLLVSYHNSNELQEVEKVFIIGQMSLICRRCCNDALEMKTISNIVEFQIKDLSIHNVLSQTVMEASFSGLIGCVQYIYTQKDMSMRDYLLFMRSIVDLCAAKMATSAVKFKTLHIYTSLSKYIDEQLSVEYENAEINEKMFPSFGSVLCHLCFFLLSKTDFVHVGKLKENTTQIMEWIKDCFKVARQSLGSRSAKVGGRQRMLSISSLCSEDGTGNDTIVETDWSIQLLDILLKMYDEHKHLMNEAVVNIVIVMVRTRTLGMVAIRHLKNLIFSDSARRKKISELESLTTSSESVPQSEKDIEKYNTKLRYLKEGSTKIISTALLQSDDIDIVASCLFVMLDICSSADRVLINDIKCVIDNFHENPMKRYLDCKSVVDAINSILTLSNEPTKYDGFTDLATTMIVGLMNRCELDDRTVECMQSLCHTALYEKCGHLQNAVLMKAFAQNTDMSWRMRQSWLSCLQTEKGPRISKYNAFIIVKSVIQKCQQSEQFAEFAELMMTVCVNTLLPMNFDKSNGKYVIIVFECLTELFKYRQVHDLHMDLLNKLDSVIQDETRKKIFRPLLKFYDMYKRKIFSIRKMDNLYENDDHLTYLLKLLPIEFTKDMDEDVCITSKTIQESKGVSKFALNSRTTLKGDEALKSNPGAITDKDGSDNLKKRKNKDESQKVIAKKSKIETGNKANIGVPVATEEVEKAVPKREKRVKKKKTKDIKPAVVADETVKSKKHKKDKIQDAEMKVNEVEPVSMEVSDKKKKKENIIQDVEMKVVEEEPASTELGDKKKKKKSKKVKVKEIKTKDVEIKAIEMKCASNDGSKKKKAKKNKTVALKDTEMTPVSEEVSKKKKIKNGEVKPQEAVVEKKDSLLKKLEKKQRRNQIRKEKRNEESNAMDLD